MKDAAVFLAAFAPFLIVLAGAVFAVRWFLATLSRRRREEESLQPGGAGYAALAADLAPISVPEDIGGRPFSDWLAARERMRVLVRAGRFLSRILGLAALAYLLHAQPQGARAFAAVAGMLVAVVAEAGAYLFSKQVARELAPFAAAAFGLSYARGPQADDPDKYPLFPGALSVSLRDIFSGADHRIYAAWYEQEGRDSKGRKTKVTVLNNTVFEITFARPFEGKTQVRRDGGRLLNALQAALGASDMARVNLAYDKFEKVFEVYGTSQVEARAILTPDMLENLLGIRALERFGAALHQVLFQGNKMYMHFFRSGALPPVSLARPFDAEALLRDFSVALALVRKLEDGVSLRPYRARD